MMIIKLVLDVSMLSGVIFKSCGVAVAWQFGCVMLAEPRGSHGGTVEHWKRLYDCTFSRGSYAKTMEVMLRQ